MAQIRTGLASVTNGSATVSFDTLDLISNGVAAGDYFLVVGDAVRYVIASVSGSPAQAQLSAPYSGTTNTAAAYVIHDSFTTTLELPLPFKGDQEQATLIRDAFQKLDDAVLVLGSPASAITIGADTFLELPDTPGSFSGQAGKIVKVNPAETALIFEDEASGGGTTGSPQVPADFLLLNDTPASYAGNANKLVTVNTSETGLQFSTDATVDHDQTTNYVPNEHINHSSVSINAGTGLTGGGTITTSRTLNLSAALQNLTDVTTTGVSDNDVLVYNSTSGLWEPDDLSASLTLGGLSDVVLGSPISDNDTLSYNSSGGYWEATTAVLNLDGLTDVNIGSPSTNDVLTYDGSQWIPKATQTVIDWTTPVGSPIIHIDNIPVDEIDHDALLNYDSNEHIDHTAVSVSAGLGLTGGGDISSSITLHLDASIFNLNDTMPSGSPYPFGSPSTGTDHILIFDGSNWTNETYTTAIDHDQLTNYVANEHVDHTSVSINAGTGLSGGGDISATRTLNLDANLSDLLDVNIGSPSTNDVLTFDGNNWVPQTSSLSPENIKLEINQASHGFDVGQAIYYSDTTGWALAQSDDVATIGTHIVVEVIDSDNFYAGHSGRFTLTGSPTPAITVGWNYVSDSTAGALTTIEPTDTNSYSNPLVYAFSSTDCLVFPYRASIISLGINLDDLDDVSASSPNDEDLLTYNGGSGDWESVARTSIDHDALTNYVVNEHIDWTTPVGSPIIHIDNIPVDEIDHDALLNYDSNEHIDWTTPVGSPIIHIDNIPVDEIDHDALLNYDSNEHIDWTQSQSGSPEVIVHPDNLRNLVEEETAGSPQYTLLLEDAGKIKELHGDLLVPTHASVSFPIGTQVHIVQQSTIQVFISGDAGVTINAARKTGSPATSVATRTQYSALTIYKRDTNEWTVFGDLAGEE